MSEAQADWRGSVALVLASSTGGVGQHVASLARGLVASGCRVLVCGPAATDEQFGFSAAGAGFAAVEIPAAPGPQDSGAVRALRRLHQAMLAVDPKLDVVAGRRRSSTFDLYAA